MPVQNPRFYSPHIFGILFSDYLVLTVRPSVRPSVYGVIQLGPAHNTLQTPMTTYFDTLSKVRPHPFHPPVLRAPVEMR